MALIGISVSSLLLALSLSACRASPTGSTDVLPIRISTRTALSASGIANVHLRDEQPHAQKRAIDVTYGACAELNKFQSDHKLGGLYPRSGKNLSRRLVWLIPRDVKSGGCLSVWDGETGELLGRSEALTIGEESKLKMKRDGISMGPENGIDTTGPWFDGVEYLKSKNLTEVETEKAKNKRIAIVGGGMSGLMTGLLLDSVGLRNWHILEASGRVGGRIRTVHFGGQDDYQYQEMGPMRFPESIQYAGSNETLPFNDQKLVFQLGSKLNAMNKNNPKYAVNFIPWYQSSQNAPVFLNGVRLEDGTVPTVQDMIENPSLQVAADEGIMADELATVREKMGKTFFNPERMGELAADVYRAHKKFIDEGWEDWSEFGYIHNLLGASLNTTDILGGGDTSFWSDLFENTFFSATNWKTIDKGLNRLPEAIKPHIKNRISYNKFVTSATFNKVTEKLTISTARKWTDRKSTTSESFDYAVVSAPFTMVRKMKLPPLSSTLSRAISNLQYADACKVALHFKTRFWEHLPKPIFGGCAFTDIPGVQSFCYPSYKMNSTGPGVMLGSYNFAEWSMRTVQLSDKDHAEYVLDAMAEIHGPVVREQYTGKFNRQCWLLDEYTNGGWAHPSVGQHALYIPSYFRTENNMIFIGEHTSFTHAWIASALDSAIRGTVQLLLDLGLVDEAKKVSREWMGRWINV